jgi:two-component system sensor histidine kinase KdpD
MVVALTLAVALALKRLLHLPDLEMLFLLAVMVTAFRWGRGPAMVAAFLGVAAYDFFFVPPLHTFSVDDHRYVLTFAMMFGVGLVMSQLAERLRLQERRASAREARTGALYALTRELAQVEEREAIANIAAKHASELFSAHAWVLLDVSVEDDIHVVASSNPSHRVGAEALALARWSRTHHQIAGVGTSAFPSAPYLCAPLNAGARPQGVLALKPIHGASFGGEATSLLELFCAAVAGALDRAAFKAEARVAALRAKTEEMRASLLSAVSHDLRTPLASITGAATSLRDAPNLSSETRAELLDSVVDEADRLERLVANLLDMTRLDSGAVEVRRDWVPLEEVLGAALTRLEGRLATRRVDVDLGRSAGSEGPWVHVDPVLFEQLFVNLLENAQKYAPQTSSIEIATRTLADAVEIDVRDHGPGIPVEHQELVFEKFYRGSHAGVGGVGLGLPICRAIVEAHGGQIRIVEPSGGGACVRVTLPLGTPPRLEAEASAHEP